VGRFNVVASEHHTWAEVASYYKEFSGLEIVETDLGVYSKVVGAPYQIKYDRLFHRMLDNSKVLRATGVKQSDFVDLREGLKRELCEFKRNPRFQYPDLIVNARLDEVAGSRILLEGLGFRERLGYYAGYCAERFPLLRTVLDARAKARGLLLKLTRGGPSHARDRGAPGKARY
jgi:hypothetical protein